MSNSGINFRDAPGITQIQERWQSKAEKTRRTGAATGKSSPRGNLRSAVQREERDGTGGHQSSQHVASLLLPPPSPGVGITMVIISTFVTIYYNVIIGYSLYYLFASFQKVLPWENCDPDWATENCSKTPKGMLLRTS